MPRQFGLLLLSISMSALVLLSGCSNNNGVNAVDIPVGEYVVMAWNDLGMHCLNPTYDEAVILPPYNTIWAQVIKRGNPPEIITTGITVSYRLVDNTSSYGKSDGYGGDFAQFWDHAEQLFGVVLAQDTGLNLVEPTRHNGLSGVMVPSGTHFEVDGVPAVPVDDAGQWNPYQVAEITVTDNTSKAVLVQTRATVPTSDEINCVICHAQDGPGTVSIGGGGPSVFGNILAAHDALHTTDLQSSGPVLCASCHSSPVLGTPGPASPAMYLSAAIHGSHADRNTICYDCHPGIVTRCSRSIVHSGPDGNCITCHGVMDQVASSITQEARIPWLSEPACKTCHGDVQDVDTGANLYRNASGHGGLSCPACHGSPHAMLPSDQASDNHQAMQYQSRAVTIGSCGACHDSSRGEGTEEFGETHGGTAGRRTACHVCHTVVSTNTSAWPHAYTWHSH
jgi:hypothetical protein